MKRPAGRYRHRVDLFKPTKTTDPKTGQSVTTWGEPFANVAAEIISNGGGTSVRVSQVDITYSHTVYIRQSNLTREINPTWRLGYKGRTFEISSIEPDDETGRIEWQLACAEKVIIGG